jgi:hypothetical protein
MYTCRLATPSNCLDIPSGHWYRWISESWLGTPGKPGGMVITQCIGTMGSQVLRAANSASYGCSSQTKWWWVQLLSCTDRLPGLRYSRPSPRGGLWEDSVAVTDESPQGCSVTNIILCGATHAGVQRGPAAPEQAIIVKQNSPSVGLFTH